MQADFFLNRPKERERRVRQLVAQNFERRVEHYRHAGPIVGPQAGVGVGRTDRVPFAHRLGADADRHRVHVGHQQSAIAAHRAGHLKNEVADFARQRAFAMGVVGANRGGGRTGGAKFIDDVINNRPLVPARAGDGHQLHDHLEGLLVIDALGGRLAIARGLFGGWTFRFLFWLRLGCHQSG